MSAELQKVVRDRMDSARASIRAWLLASVSPGIQVVDQHQYKPQPPFPYVSFGFLGGLIKLGRNDSFPYNKQLHAFKVRMQRQATLTIEAHGTPFTDKYSDLYRATDILSGIQANIDEPIAYANLSKNGIAIWGDGSVIDTTVFEDNVYMPRATLDVTIGLSMEALIDPGFIERVRITGHLDTNFDGVHETDFGPYTFGMEEDS